MYEAERLIERLDRSRNAMQRAVSSVDAGLELCPGWTIREMLAHIAGWDEVGTRTVLAHAAGMAPEPLEIQGIDAYNDILIAKCEALSHEEVIQYWRRSRRELVHALEQTPPERFQERVEFPWGETGNITRLVSILAEHEVEHAHEILELVSGDAE